MKTILIRTDEAIGSREYGRMLALELADRGVRTVTEETEGVTALLTVCDLLTDEEAEEAGALAKRLGLPVLVCARELEAPLPSGVVGVERPLDVKRLCDTLAAEETARSEPIPDSFILPAAKEGIVIDRLSKKVFCQGEPIALTAREYHLLCYLDDRRGTPIPREELAREVWGLPLTETNVVDVYIRYLRKKLDEPFNTRFLVTERGKGYLLKKE